MSIAILAKKTRSTVKAMSTGTGFSLNGTHRNTSYIGQTSLSRFTPSPSHTQLPCCNGGGNIIPSVVSTSGMLATKYRWIRRGFPYTHVSPFDYRTRTLTASEHTAYLNKQRYKCDDDLRSEDIPTCTTWKELPREARSRVSRLTNICPYQTVKPDQLAKPFNKRTKMEQGEYLARLNAKCVVDNSPMNPTVDYCRTPFICNGQ